MPLADLLDRQYVSRYANDVLSLDVRVGGQPADVDGNAVTVTFIREGDGTVSNPDVTVFERAADRFTTGLYETVLSSAETDTPGYYRVEWAYAINGDAQTYVTYVEIGYASPPYDSLDAGMKQIVDSVWIRFADLFDSPYGGPNLTTYFQSNYGRGRIAQLLRIAVGKLNTMAQPYQTYTVDMPGQFPVQQWGPLLENATYVEAIKHLVRSYVEQPEAQVNGVSRLDRRDYMQRWQSVLQMEEESLKEQFQTFKIRNMGFGRPRVLVSGGVFGRYGPTRFAGSVAARPRYWTRFYTVAVLLSGLCLGGHHYASHHPQNSSPPTSGPTSISQEA